MKSLCPYSGLEHETHAFKGIRVPGSPHPIFYLPADKLLFLAARWNEDHVIWDEKKLLFTAMLKATELVEFRAPMKLDVETVYKYMNRLIAITIWKTTVFHPKPFLSRIGFGPGKDFDHFPHLVIDSSLDAHDNNVGLWILQLEDIRHTSETGRSRYYENRMTAEAREKQDKLTRIIRNSMMQSKSGIERKLGVFAINAAPPRFKSGQIDIDLREYWLSLFTIKPPAIFRVDHIDYADLIEHMGANLFHGDISAHHVMKHLRAQQKLCKSDEAAYFGIDDITVETNTRYMDELTEAAKNAPVDEPLRKDFPNDLAFTKARSIWRLAQEQVKVATKVAADNSARLQGVALATSYIAEDAADGDGDSEDIAGIAGISGIELIQNEDI